MSNWVYRLNLKSILLIAYLDDPKLVQRRYTVSWLGTWSHLKSSFSLIQRRSKALQLPCLPLWLCLSGDSGRYCVPLSRWSERGTWTQGTGEGPWRSLPCTLSYTCSKYLWRALARLHQFSPQPIPLNFPSLQDHTCKFCSSWPDCGSH